MEVAHFWVGEIWNRCLWIKDLEHNLKGW